MTTSNPRDVWDRVFATVDPWSYDDLYERTKRNHVLQMIPRSATRALEIGCAEGHLTVNIAALVGHLVAIDASSRALQRAAARCAHLGNIDFLCMDTFVDLPPGMFDLIICSEVLYYVRNRFALTRFIRRLIARIHQGGYLVVAHSNAVSDNRTKTGFDFHEFGAVFIAKHLGSRSRLVLMKELETDLYRIQVFTRHPRLARRTHAVERISVAFGMGADDRARPLVKWGGCSVTNAEARHLWRSPEIAILMYHRVAESGPPDLAPYRVTSDQFREQLAFLRREGYRAISIPHAVQLLQEPQPPAGRFVVFTFDDAYTDFYETAWPLLREYGFEATLFVPVAWVGLRAEWDQEYGEPAPLMNWEQIVSVHRQGARIGSHAMDHRRLVDLSADELRQQFVGSSDILTHAIGVRPEVFSYPFNSADAAARTAAATSGYRHAVLGPGLLRRGADAHAVPRQEVYGHHTLVDFAKLLGRQLPAPFPDRLRYYWRHAIRDRRTYTDF